MRRTISNSNDIIDSRDVIERIDELTSERDAAKEAAAEVQSQIDALSANDVLSAEDEDTLTTLRARLWTSEHDEDNVYDNEQPYDENDDDELHALLELQNEADGCADWRHGEALIRDSYFETYAQQLADDIGAISRDAKWPTNHIDWEAAAEELKQDYTSVDFDGTTYWIRS